jgi:hypothetical protein
MRWHVAHFIAGKARAVTERLADARLADAGATSNDSLAHPRTRPDRRRFSAMGREVL